MYGKYKVYVEFVRYDGVTAGRFWYGGPGDRNRNNPNWGVIDFSSSASATSTATLSIFRIDVSQTRGGWESPLYRLNANQQVYATVETTPGVESTIKLVLKPFGDTTRQDILVQEVTVEGGIYTATIRNNWNAVGKYKLYATATELYDLERTASRYWFPYDERSSTRGIIEFVSTGQATTRPTITTQPTSAPTVTPTAQPTSTVTPTPSSTSTAQPTTTATVTTQPTATSQPSATATVTATTHPPAGPLVQCEQTANDDGSVDITLLADRAAEAGWFQATPCEITIGSSTFSLSLDHMWREAGAGPAPIENNKDKFYISTTGATWEKAQSTDKCNLEPIGTAHQCWEFKRTESPYYLTAGETQFTADLIEFGFTRGILNTGLFTDNNFRNGQDSFVKLKITPIEEETPTETPRAPEPQENREATVTTVEGVTQVELSFNSPSINFEIPAPTEEVEVQDKFLGILWNTGSHTETREIQDPGTLVYRLDDETNCLEVSQEGGRTLNINVKPLCGVCDSDNIYERKITYSFGRVLSKEFEMPIRVACDANVVFLTDLEILNHDSSLETALTNWVEKLREEEKGVWVVDLSDEATMQSLGGETPSNGVKLSAGRIKTIVDKMLSFADNEYLVIGGGVDVIPMPAMATAIKFDDETETGNVLNGNVLNDYCYTKTNYNGENCVGNEEQAENGLIIGRMLTEKSSGTVRGTLLIKMLETATRVRHVTREITLIGQQCGNLEREGSDDYCTDRNAFDRIVNGIDGEKRVFYSPLDCPAGSGGNSWCSNANAFETAISTQGAIYLSSHGTGGTNAHSTAIVQNNAILGDTANYFLPPDPIPADVSFPWQNTLTHDFLNTHQFNGGLLIYGGCYGGAPDYASNYGCNHWPGCRSALPMTIETSTAMHALSKGLAAIVGCTREGYSASTSEKYLLLNILNENVGTIGKAFNRYKTQTTTSETIARYQRSCEQFYGDPTVSLGDEPPETIETPTATSQAIHAFGSTQITFTNGWPLYFANGNNANIHKITVRLSDGGIDNIERRLTLDRHEISEVTSFDNISWETKNDCFKHETFGTQETEEFSATNPVEEWRCGSGLSYVSILVNAISGNSAEAVVTYHAA
ncbi:MAG: hypothetical protein V1811_01150 [Candidatus Micrarchaeota archaeon]